MKYLTAPQITRIHDSVIHPHELQGEAADKSIVATIARVENRLVYGLIHDVFELAACYASVIAVANAFNDANKRTAFAAMDTVLALNGIELTFPSEVEAGDMIRKIVLGEIDEGDLADWLRALPSN